MGAQHRAGTVGSRREIERVVILPRRMLGRDVERGEVVEVGLNIRPLGNREAHIGEDLGDLVGHLAHGVDAALGKRPFAHRKRDIGVLCGELPGRRGLGEFLPLGLERLAYACLQAVDDLAVGLALIRRK